MNERARCEGIRAASPGVAELNRCRLICRAIAVAPIAMMICATAALAQVRAPDGATVRTPAQSNGRQGSAEIAFDPASGLVTLKLPAQDVDRAFAANLRRRDFAVFEDDRRQQDVTVDVEHAPITVAILMELGGRSQQLNRALATEAPYFGRKVVEVLGPDDKLAVFTYDDRLRTLMDFDAPAEKWDASFSGLQAPSLSEANFYDAAIEVLDRLKPIQGRKALLVISTGIDTFSRATFDEVVRHARQVQTPVYVIGLDDVARRAVLDTSRGPLARVDWNRCQQQLAMLARESGGTAYAHVRPVDLPTIYDDLMENLRVRYVIRYAPPPATRSAVRKVQVRLIGSAAGNGARTEKPASDDEGPVVAEASYTPPAVAMRDSDEPRARPGGS